MVLAASTASSATPDAVQANGAKGNGHETLGRVMAHLDEILLGSARRVEW